MKGRRLVGWEIRKGGRLVRWQGEKGGRMVRQKGGRYLVLFKDGRYKLSPRFHLSLFLVLIKGTKGWDWFKIFLRVRRDRKTLLRSFASC